jgi:hypothetical protein
MTLPLLLLFGLYNPQHWRIYPSMSDIRCISYSNRDVYVAVPAGVYVLGRSDWQCRRTLTAADGLRAEVRLCAFFPGRNVLFIATDERLYEYVPSTDLLNELNTPFHSVRSIGIAPDAPYFQTDAGWFRKARVAPVFQPVGSGPAGATWYGELDSSDVRDFPILTPYSVMDEHLNSHPLALVRTDGKGRRLFVAARDYGLLVYDARMGFAERHIRLGPPAAAVRRIVRLDGRLWFLAPDQTLAIDSAGVWTYFGTRPGELAQSAFRLLLPGILDLDRRESIRAVLADTLGLFVGTGCGLHWVDAERRLSRLHDLPRGVNALARVRDSLLVGTDDGLFLMVNDTLTSVTDPFARFDWGVYDIARTTDGSAFFGTLGGIVRLTPADTWARLLPPGIDLGQPVRALAAAGDCLFHGSTAGLGAYDWRTGAWLPVESPGALSLAGATALHADDHFLWIAFPSLLVRYDYRAALH